MGLPAVVVMKNPNERLAFSVSVRRGEQRWAGHASAIAILTKAATPTLVDCRKVSRRGKWQFFRARFYRSMSALPKTNYIKSIVTSECKMDMERKGVQSYQSQLYVRFLCFGNGALTALHDKSDGFFRRQIVLTTKDRPAGRADDPFLVDKLLREKEGIFLWCLEGLRRLIGNNYQFSISGKARENMETVKRSSNNVIEFLQSEGYIRFRADSEASSKAIYEAYTRWCDDNAQKPMSANRVSSELAQNERLYNVEATNNVHVGGKRVRGFVGIEVVNPPPY